MQLLLLVEAGHQQLQLPACLLAGGAGRAGHTTLAYACVGGVLPHVLACTLLMPEGACSKGVGWLKKLVCVCVHALAGAAC